MTPVRLTTWFRPRMATLVLSATAIAWLAVTVGYHLQKRRETILLCRSEASYVAPLMAQLIQRRPVLWKYDGAKIADQIASQGIRPGTAVLLRDAHGQPVNLGSFGVPPARPVLWGHANIVVGNSIVAHVWVGADASPLWRHTAIVALLSGLVAGLLAAMLYLVPVRTVARAERRIVGLMSRLALAMQEGERSRIARDLHDGAGQAITAARLGLLALRRSAAHPVDSGQLDRITALLDGALDEVRRSSSVLMPPALGELGLQGAIERHCEGFSVASGMSITCEIPTTLPAVPDHVQTACYRIVQEALTNAARHSNAANAVVRLHATASDWELEIVDDGRGFEPAAVKKGTGLQSIQERARLLGGTFELGPAPGGTRVRVVFPRDGGDE